MNIIAYCREKGLKHALNTVYMYKLNLVFLKIMKPLYKGIPLKDIIMIESHNDFDSNGGAFYDYLISHGYNRKYRIVWLLKNKLDRSLPDNVFAVPLHAPSFRRCHYLLLAKFLTYDNDCLGKFREDQKAIYFGHGGFALKDASGLMNCAQKADYVVMPSHFIAPIYGGQYGLIPNDPRMCYTGFPYIDKIYKEGPGDLKKITDRQYDKVILWMPTFRKGGGAGRQDSRRVGALGVPLLETQEQVDLLNGFLAEKNSLLILKIHPMQDLSDLRIHDMSNIKVLTASDVKKLHVDNYRLMKDVSAMVTDYSSIAYDFLHLDKPIAYDLSDLEDYTIGLLVEKPEDYMAGPVIKTEVDLLSFITDVCNDRDGYHDQRIILRNKLFDDADGNSAERAVKLLGI